MREREREKKKNTSCCHCVLHSSSLSLLKCSLLSPLWLSLRAPASPCVRCVPGGGSGKGLRSLCFWIGKIKALHLYDCLRANKSTSAWGVEARVPFLDKEFINVAMSIDPEWKMVRPDLGRIEKWVLRNAFDDEHNPYLPKHILYRQKEQFSDGVGYSWIDGLKDHANEQVTDAMLMNASFVYPENTPTTKEAYYYRSIFEKFYPKNAARSTVPGGPSVACSTAKALEWDAAWSKNPDPSGRAALGVHEAAYEEEKDAKNANLMNGSPQKPQGIVEKATTVV